MRRFVTSILILFLFSGCGPKQQQVEKRVEDGVEVVVNHLEPYQTKGEPSTLFLEEELIIDFEIEELTELGITQINLFDADSEGSIYFSCPDREENQILKFNKNGNFETSFGPKGQGPGDINRLTNIRIDELDKIIIADDGKKLCVFDIKGKLIGQVKVAPNYRMSTFLENENILAMKEDSDQFLEKGFVTLPIVLSNRRLEEIAILYQGQKAKNWIRAEELNGLRLSTNLFLWSISNERIFIHNEINGYEFIVYDLEGNLVKKIRKEYHPVKVTKQTKEKVLQIFESPRLKELKISDKVYFPDFMPPVQYFFTDNSGRLFVMTYEKGEGPEEYMYDIFNPDGLFIGRTSLANSGNKNTAAWGGPFEVKAKNERLYCMRIKESGYQKLVIYKMKWE